jgi:Helicase associated domain
MIGKDEGLVVDTGDGKRSGKSRRPVPRRDWEEQLVEYVLFVKERSRVPSQSSEDFQERALNAWLMNQRASLRNGVLFRERAARLDELLPGWNGPQQQPLGWDEMFAGCVQFATGTGRRPSALSSNPAERALAIWLQRQGSARAAIRDLKHAEHVVKLDQALPGWRRRGDYLSWDGRLVQLLEHLRTHGQLPVLGLSSSPDDYALGKWISVQRNALKKGTLAPERLAKLNGYLPGWQRPNE